MSRKPHVFKRNGVWFCSSGKGFPASTQGETAHLAYTHWKWGGAIASSWQCLPSSKDKP
jgi:hypothetical protein